MYIMSNVGSAEPYTFGIVRQCNLPPRHPPPTLAVFFRPENVMASDLNVQLEDLMGPAWADIWCNQKYLFLPGWRRGFEVGELRSMFWKVARVHQLKRQVAQLERDMARRVAECEAAETRCEFYRNQCQMEAKFGLMMARIAA